MKRTDQVALVTSALRTSFRSFCGRSFETVNGGKQLSTDPYVNVVCATLEEVAAGEVRRLILNLPPRHLKTSLASVCFPAWELAHHPDHHVMIVCYGEDLAKNIAYKVRTILRSDWFKQTFQCQIAEDHGGVADFRTRNGGGLFATSFGGGTTGRGADLLIVDDANKIEDATSPEQLERVILQFNTAIASRLDTPRLGRIVIVAHRIDAADLSGFLLDDGGWQHLMLPLIANEATTYNYGHGVWKRQKGELLRPDAYSEVDVEKLRSRSRRPDFQTLYQQNPSGRAWLLKETDFPLFSKTPYSPSGIVLSIDTAQSAGDRSSFSVIQVWQGLGDSHYLLDQWRDRASYDELCKSLRRLVNRYQPSVILIENTGVGAALLNEAQRRGDRAGIVVNAISPGSKGKVERLDKVIDVVKAKSVWLPEGAEWKPLFIDEVTSFPSAGSDDQVDAMTQYLAWALKNKVVPARPPRCMGITVDRFGNTSSGNKARTMPFGLPKYR